VDDSHAPTLMVLHPPKWFARKFRERIARLHNLNLER
jgi:hypothetical protein